MDRLFLIDGHALIFKMYYAFLPRPMVNSKGVNTSILFGFTKYILELIRRENATHIAIALDPPCKTFRHEMYPEYKGTRSATPELVKESYEPITEIIKALNIPLLVVEGYEADDVLGAMARKCASKDTQVYLVTPDKDYGQLIGENIFQYKPGKSGSDNQILGTAEICEKYGIKEPKELIDILALWGDTADNVPGARGIGEVGARKLISKYGSIENIYGHLDELSAKQAASLQESRDNVFLSKKLVTIVTDIPLKTKIEDTILEAPDKKAIMEIFSDLEMNSLVHLLPHTDAEDLFSMSQTKEDKPEIKYEIAEKPSDLDTGKSRISLRLHESVLYISDGYRVYTATSPRTASDILADPRILKIGYDLKGIIKFLKKENISLEGELADIEIMHYLINPEVSHQIEILSRSYLNTDLDTIEQAEGIAAGTRPEPDLFSQTVQEPQTSAIARCAILDRLYEAVLADMDKDTNLRELYMKIEMPLIRVLADMEFEGFRVDLGMLDEFSRTLTAKYLRIEDDIRKLVEEPTLNVSSPKQLGAVLFEKLRLDPKVKKKASGSYPTDEETLNAYKNSHPVIPMILEYRELRKLVNTYLSPFPELVDRRTGNIHTTFNQSLTATGRLSSSKPNLQNIPIRTDLGKEIRKAFISSHKDGLIVSADYSQIELRIMAILSQDESLTEDFREGKDIHTSTAAKVFKVAEKDVTQEQRRQAKTANFGIIYGISAFGLAQRLDIPRNEAKSLIDEYFKHYTGVERYINMMKEKARTDGYVETLFHRKRFLPDINSRNQVVRGLAERNAVNAPIQGSAADIIKLAMIKVAGDMRENGLRSRMILQVHDELIFDVYPEELDNVMEIVRNGMENAVKLSIPLTVECNYGKNWLEAH